MSQGKAYNKGKIIESLEHYLKLNYSLKKACEIAGIHYTTVQKWVKGDEELSIKIKSWQNEVSSKARTNVSKEIIKGDKETSKWWLERRERKDFSTRTEADEEKTYKIEFVNHDGSDKDST